MLHRALLDPIPPEDTDADIAATAETTRAVERGERHLRLLAELSEIGMTLARSLGELAQARIETELKGEVAPGRSEDAASAVEKMAQTVRRTLALEAKLAEGVKARRQRLVTDCAERRAARAAAHKTAVGEAIMEGLHDAYAADCSDDEYHELAERLLDDAKEYLDDADEMRGYLDRPVGETVARLCAAMGLDPDACEPDGDAWRVRRPPLDFELRVEEKARRYGSASSLSLPRSGEGQTAKPSEWGAAGKPPDPQAAAAPHPDRSAIFHSP
jgi:hypothetical protein